MSKYIDYKLERFERRINGFDQRIKCLENRQSRLGFFLDESIESEEDILDCLSSLQRRVCKLEGRVF